jgi:hypothetical protein
MKAGLNRLPIELARLAAFCEANGIRKLSLFGSQLNGPVTALSKSGSKESIAAVWPLVLLK